VLEGLIDRFQLVRRTILGYGTITERELDGILKEIKITLLEADVNYKVAKRFIEELKEKCASLELSRSLKPGDLVIKAVFEELVQLLGSSARGIEFKKTPLVISLVGLQGVGKTTTAAKLAVMYKEKKPLLVPADAKRPAAAEQLALLGKRADVPVGALRENSAVATVSHARGIAEKHGNGLIIIDTAGRLHIDEDLIDELKEINRAVTPDYTVLVADGMSGQDAVNQAVAFNEKIGVDGAVLTKMDGDARGGAALSIRWAAHVPILFIGTSENLDGIEQFYPDRVAQRILGMGDLATLVDRVKGLEQEIDEQKLRQKVVHGDLNFEDFLEQMKAVKKMGSLGKLAAMIPGVRESDVNEDELRKAEAMINSMTRRERLKPHIIDGSRKRRIAAGSGTTVRDVNLLLKQFSYTRDLLKKMGKGKLKGNFPFKL
jgi:signal recognition particle subunit SRP54